MSELRCSAKSALDFFESFDVVRAHLNQIVLFVRGDGIVQRRGEFGRNQHKVTLEIDEIE